MTRLSRNNHNAFMLNGPDQVVTFFSAFLPEIAAHRFQHGNKGAAAIIKRSVLGRCRDE